ncbi:MAG: hypothetical protein IJZ16_10265 [Clostridia bacterium]|nr:hypothetical protein [Clostridia bacterium]
MSKCENLPKMMTIREVARTGLLSEYALRQLHKQGKLPCIALKNKVLINFDALVAQLQQLKGVNS